jgi:hypothetical protein
MAATWQQIYEGETDTNSPISQTLLDKIRENLDYLFQAGAQMMYFDFDYNNPGTALAWVQPIESSKDWRDRIVEVIMVGYAGARGPLPNQGVGSLIPGQNNDMYWHTDIDAHGDGTVVSNVGGSAVLEEQLYTRIGVPDPSPLTAPPNEPYIEAAYVTGTIQNMRVYVNDTTYYLMVQFIITGAAVAYREGVAQGRIIYSGDRGAH